ncbi:MAG: sarcosine oxidase subunit delta [Alphaproteobacteria bacterium]|nr:sarcosine oxidase subunit delta [Alphaproteobacteria bacterium]
MLHIPCPHCGTRDQSEFSHHGEAYITRPENPKSLSDKDWGDYVFFRKNTKGDYAELWMHRHGCRKFFHLLRNSLSDEIYGSCKLGDSTEKTIAKIVKANNKKDMRAIS